mmetsp:Transcript_5043/g.10995  ORF Transcript_5043/g.10995 Transcript_5043/m.10995 type:complete len:146 (+) Transcript_5043:133-570(+)
MVRFGLAASTLQKTAGAGGRRVLSSSSSSSSGGGGGGGGACTPSSSLIVPILTVLLLDVSAVGPLWPGGDRNPPAATLNGIEGIGGAVPTRDILLCELVQLYVLDGYHKYDLKVRGGRDLNFQPKLPALQLLLLRSWLYWDAFVP